MMFPGVVVRDHRLPGSPRHRPEAVAEQVYARGQGWEFFAVALHNHPKWGESLVIDESSVSLIVHQSLLNRQRILRQFLANAFRLVTNHRIVSLFANRCE